MGARSPTAFEAVQHTVDVTAFCATRVVRDETAAGFWMPYKYLIINDLQCPNKYV
jgi:hypothetical protein